jgi:hypothetical protein
MSNPHPLEIVAAELRRHGLPPAEVARLLQELEDHIVDLFTEQGGRMNEPLQVNEGIESRLGRPEILVAAALANRRQASIFGRHPILSFVVAPIPLAFLSWVVFLFVGFGVFEMVGWVFGEQYAIEGRAVRDWPAILVFGMKTMEIALRFLPPALAGALLCWCAIRAGLSWWWPLTASSLVALVASAVIVQVNLPVEPGQGKVILGLALPISQLGLRIYNWISLLQFVVPLAVGAAFLWRERNRAIRKA